MRRSIIDRAEQFVQNKVFFFKKLTLVSGVDIVIHLKRLKATLCGWDIDKWVESNIFDVAAF